MANSRKRCSSSSSKERAPDLVAGVATQLAGLVRRGSRLAIGLSGGVDSVVLLDVLQRLSARLGFRLSALHVNHQLSPNAVSWAAFCRSACRARGIPIRCAKVKVRRGAGLEAAAREARYAQYAREPCDFVVLAHHQDDQVETVLLQLLRGAGVKGVAAMPVVRSGIQDSGFRIREGQGIQDSGFGIQGEKRAGKTAGSPNAGSRIPNPAFPNPGVLRPLLDFPRSAILEYARARGLEWIEDESNADDRLRRNFLRHEVLPLVARRFPAYRGTIARAARHFADADKVLAEIADADGAGGDTLDVGALQRLSPGRARNALRHFLAGHGVTMPSAERLDEALRQALRARLDAQVAIDVGHAQLRRFDGRLHVMERLPATRAGWARPWRGERRLVLPELGGILLMERRRGEGVSLARLRGRPVVVRVRSGGERLQPDCSRPRRTLKNLLQEARVPPWTREHLPLVFCGGDLVWAPGIGPDCAYQAQPEERSVVPEWQPAGTGFGHAARGGGFRDLPRPDKLP